MATVRAATHCQLVMIKRKDVDEILPHFPLINRYESTCSGVFHRIHLNHVCSMYC